MVSGEINCINTYQKIFRCSMIRNTQKLQFYTRKLLNTFTTLSLELCIVYRGGNRKKTFLADLTCKKLHSSYLKYFADLGMDNKTMAYSTFRHFVHQRFPQLKFTSREAILGPVTSGAPGDPGVSINVSASDRHDTVLSIQTETHQQFD